MRHKPPPQRPDLLARLPRALRPRLDPQQLRDLALCHLVNLDAVATGTAEPAILWDWVGSALTWHRARQACAGCCERLEGAWWRAEGAAMSANLDLDDVSNGHPMAQRQLEELREDATCYRWLVAHWGRIVTDTCDGGIDAPRGVRVIELGPDTLRDVHPESLHRAILRAMAA